MIGAARCTNARQPADMSFTAQHNKRVNHIFLQCPVVNMYRLWSGPETCKPYLFAMPNGVHISSLELLCMVMTKQKLVTPALSKELKQVYSKISNKELKQVYSKISNNNSSKDPGNRRGFSTSPFHSFTCIQTKTTIRATCLS